MQNSYKRVVFFSSPAQLCNSRSLLKFLEVLWLSEGIVRDSSVNIQRVETFG